MSFTLTMLGTDTLFTPEPETGKKKAYPRGETLSVISTIIEGEPEKAPPPAASAKVSNSSVSAYVSEKVEVVIGPSTLGKNVDDRIWRGVLAVLKAIARGETIINIISHSRGAVEAILISHEIDKIQKFYQDAVDKKHPLPDLLDVIKLLAANELTEIADEKRNTGEVLNVLKNKTSEFSEMGEHFNATIINTQINLFAIDPVPGDVAVTWYDKRYFHIPDIVTDCEMYLYENERTWGFTPINPLPSNKPGSKFLISSIPGHHGSASAGSNKDQAGCLVPEKKGKATHIQELMFFKIMAFLGKHEVVFKKPDDWKVDDGGLLSLAKELLEKKDDSEQVLWSEERVLPICFGLYSDIYKNIAAYQHFNATNYQYLGKAAAHRNIINEGYKYVKFSDIIPPSHGYVNAEHTIIAEKILFKLLGIEEAMEALSLPEVVQKSTLSLYYGIESLIDSVPQNPSMPPHPVTVMLTNPEGKKQVIDCFGILVDRVSQTYMRNHMEEQEKKALLDSVIHFFRFTQALLEICEKAVNKAELITFITAIMDKAKIGITNTLTQQFQGLQDDVDFLRKIPSAPLFTDDDLKEKIRLLVYSSFAPEVAAEDNKEEIFNQELEKAFAANSLRAGEDKNTHIWTSLTTALLQRDDFWNEETKVQIREFPAESLLEFIKKEQQQVITVDNFAKVCERLNDFRMALENFKQFQLEINFVDMERALEGMEWDLVHKAADFVAGKEKTPQKIDWTKFEEYVTGITILHGVVDPVKVELNEHIARVKKTLGDVRLINQDLVNAIAEQKLKLLELQEKIRELESESEEQIARNEELSQTNLQQKEELAEKQAEIKQQLADFDLKLLNAAPILAEKEQKLKELEEKFTQAQSDLETLTQTTSEQKDEIAQKQVEIEQQQARFDEKINEKTEELAEKARQLEDSARLMEEQTRELDEKESEFNRLKEEIRQANENAAKQKEFIDELSNGVHVRHQNECLALITGKLVPLTEKYLAHLKSQKTGSLSPKACSLIDEKITSVETLMDCLVNKTTHALPSNRLALFANELMRKDSVIRAHRDGPWTRYLRNVLVVGGILLTGVVPGLAALAIYTAVSDRQSMLFWRSHGNTLSKEINELLPTAMKTR